jgi:DNA-binding NarL/FixJ family response regulator
MALRTLLLSRDPDVIRVFRRALDDLEVCAEVCPRAAEAKDLLQVQKFDSVILDCDDIAMADEVLCSLQTASSNRRAIAIALVNGITSMREAFAMGAHFVLEKPLTFERANRATRAAVGLMLAEQRRYFRYPLEIKVALKRNSGPQINCTSTNVSEGGMALTVPEAIPATDPVELKFTLPDLAEPIAAKAEIAWSDGKCSLGLRFIHLSIEGRRALTKWLAARTAEMEAAESAARKAKASNAVTV